MTTHLPQCVKARSAYKNVEREAIAKRGRAPVPLHPSKKENIYDDIHVSTAVV